SARGFRLVGAMLLGLLAVAVVVFGGDSRERAVLETLRGLTQALEVREGETPGRRDQRVQQAVETYFTDAVSVRHADLPRTGAGRRALLLWGRLLEKYDSAALSIQHADVTLQGERARAKLDVALSARDEAGLHQYARAAELGLVREGDGWKIESLNIAPESQAEPEARP